MRQQLARGSDFEVEVRRIARLLWPTNSHQGAQIIDGRERDGVITTEDAIHVIEATTLRTKQKAIDDIYKTSTLVLQLRQKHPEKSVRGWFITRDDLTADQMSVAEKYVKTVSSLPFKDFLGKLVDAREYLSYREKGSFGSIIDPITNHYDYPRESYVPATFYDEKTGSNLKFNEFGERAIAEGARSVILGDFGAGKSMAMRELFFRSAQKFYIGESSRFPIYLNLRNHIGQDAPVEALIRESTSVGYGRYDDIVKAWRADLTYLILDGFDELLTPAWSQKATHLREHRAACTRLIAEFFKESPIATPIVVAGRFSYFGSNAEMRSAFRLGDSSNSFRVNDFTAEQAVQLFRRMKISSAVPAWLPARPLLLGYIASYAQKKDVNFDVEEIDPAEGWDHLISRICEREADIQKGLYPDYIRQLLERIATKARYSVSILSPISQSDISLAFKEVFGREPDQNSVGMLMRLPGLVAAENQRDDRRFVDADMANVCAAGDVYNYLINAAGSQAEPFAPCRSNIDELAVDFILSKVVRSGLNEGTVWAACEHLSRMPGLGTLKGDALAILSQTSVSEKDRWTIVDDAHAGRIDLRSSPAVFKKIRLSQAVIERVETDSANLDGLPHFSGCIIGTVSGPAAEGKLDKWFGDSEVAVYERSELTNDAILDLDIPRGLKVGLTALRKLYLQPGGGRQENSFYRGISADLRPYISEALHTLCSLGYARKSNRAGSDVYLKSAEKIPEVLAILNHRGSATGALVDALRALRV
jgi:hypothetical protein